MLLETDGTLLPQSGRVQASAAAARCILSLGPTDALPTVSEGKRLPLLNQSHSFLSELFLAYRGMTAVKGKGDVPTYWVEPPNNKMAPPSLRTLTRTICGDSALSPELLSPGRGHSIRQGFDSRTEVADALGQRSRGVGLSQRRATRNSLDQLYLHKVTHTLSNAGDIKSIMSLHAPVVVAEPLTRLARSASSSMQIEPPVYASHPVLSAPTVCVDEPAVLRIVSLDKDALPMCRPPTALLLLGALRSSTAD